MQRYRSGHNEAVLKTVCPQGRVGSNPTLCVNTGNHVGGCLFYCVKIDLSCKIPLHTYNCRKRIEYYLKIASSRQALDVTEGADLAMK